MIELRTLGTSEIQTESSTLTPSQEVVFAAALYLILERDTPVRRAALASLLWADAPPRTRGHRLRQTLFQLKRLGVKVLATRDAVQISLPDTHVDFEGLADLPLSESPKTVEFLPGYDPSISRAFQDWIDRTRDYVHVLLTRCLLTQLAAARTSGNWRELDRISSVCLRLDPYNESALLARAESFAMRGQKAAAISVPTPRVSV